MTDHPRVSGQVLNLRRNVAPFRAKPEPETEPTEESPA